MRQLFSFVPPKAGLRSNNSSCEYSCEATLRAGRSRISLWLGILVIFLTSFNGTVKSKEPADLSGRFQPLYIYKDKGSRENHYVPSGFMPDGKCIALDESWMKQCQADKTCIRIEYDVDCSKQNQSWAGIYWLNPPNNWGSRKGGFNLTGAAKLSFWAKGEQGGERIQEFTLGGISGDYPDSDVAVIGPVILSNEWRKYSIDLRGKDLSYISGGFAWTTNVETNPLGCVFYLDEIKFE